MMGPGMLGTSGSNYPSLDGNRVSIDYTLGSGSAFSNTSIVFEKTNTGNYEFTEYTSKTQNYGVENLFDRQKITAAQTGKLDFSNAEENFILKKGNKNTVASSNEEPIYKAESRFNKYIPDGWRLATFAEGDLNLDDLKKDIVLVLYNENTCTIQLLLQQKKGAYIKSLFNDELIVPDENFNMNNLKAVIKNGFFTIERRVPVSDENFDHQYITFKYYPAPETWFLHRVDIEHFSGYNSKPSANVTHLTTKQFGDIAFTKMDKIPVSKPQQKTTGYRYEPAVSIISGTLIHKMVYGPPNYGETPNIDEKNYIYILKLDQPVNVYADANQPDPEIADHTLLNQTEIQTFSNIDRVHKDLKKYLNKKIKLQGVLFTGRTGGQYTPIQYQVNKILK